MRNLATQLKANPDQPVHLAGWVNSRRDHGGLIFIDLRDHTGIIQLVITPDAPAAFQVAETLRDEFVISASELSLINKSEPLPVNTHDEGAPSSEELRLKYRFLDLRRPSAQRILKRRAEFYRFMRDYMDAHDFIEIATPILANSSPEGARDFLVPSRLHPGQFYALPQAPQQFKQLLMVGGVPRYYQIAPCFRDEDPRADRLYGDFYQLDLEMSFVDDGEVVRQTVEPLIQDLVTKFAGKRLLTPDVPRYTYREVMEKYGTDKPDLRYGLELTDLTDALQSCPPTSKSSRPPASKPSASPAAPSSPANKLTNSPSSPVATAPAASPTSSTRMTPCEAPLPSSSPRPNSPPSNVSPAPRTVTPSSSVLANAPTSTAFSA